MGNLDKTKIAFFDIDGTVSKRPLPEQALKVLDGLKRHFSEIKDDYDLRLKQDMLGNHLEAAKKKYRETNDDADFGEYSHQLVGYLMSSLNRYSLDELRDVAQKAVDRALYYDFSVELIEVLRSEGYKLIAISGSPQFLVDAFVEKFNFDGGVGQIFIQDPQDLRYKPVGPETYHNKDKIIRDFLRENYDLLSGHYRSKCWDDFKIVAVGDTAGDFEMLKLAEIAFAINPSSGLLDKISQSWDSQKRFYSVQVAKNSAFAANLTDTHRVFSVQGSVLSVSQTNILHKKADYANFTSDVLRKTEEDIDIDRMIRGD
ncbi:MAG: HAD-IB family phosphatase [bacterium]|nr:HAD-IB family phosphatase [bacterium]